jgi:hypothetical protein
MRASSLASLNDPTTPDPLVMTPATDHMLYGESQPPFAHYPFSLRTPHFTQKFIYRSGGSDPTTPFPTVVLRFGGGF